MDSGAVLLLAVWQDLHRYLDDCLDGCDKAKIEGEMERLLKIWMIDGVRLERFGRIGYVAWVPRARFQSVHAAELEVN